MKNEDLFFMYWDISTLFDDFLSCGRQDEIEQGDNRGVFPVMIIGMTGALSDKYYNMQQAARVSDKTGYFYLGELVEYGETRKIFTNPEKESTQNYITGRFG